MSFKIIKKSSKSKARAGIIETNHGPVETPVFMPVGTQASVKTLSPHEVSDTGADIILANTYHLHLRPGSDPCLGGLPEGRCHGGPEAETVPAFCGRQTHGDRKQPAGVRPADGVGLLAGRLG